MKWHNRVFYVISLLGAEGLMASCDPTKQACLSEPMGILSGAEKLKQAIASLNWLFISVTISGAIIFGIKAARKLSDEQWFGALGPGVGSIVCGLGTYLAYAFIK